MTNRPARLRNVVRTFEESLGELSVPDEVRAEYLRLFREWVDVRAEHTPDDRLPTQQEWPALVAEWLRRSADMGPEKIRHALDRTLRQHGVQSARRRPAPRSAGSSGACLAADGRRVANHGLARPRLGGVSRRYAAGGGQRSSYHSLTRAGAARLPSRAGVDGHLRVPLGLERASD